MNINEGIEREYNLYYNVNKNMISAERKITIYNILGLEKEQKLNQIIKIENREAETLSITTNSMMVIIYLITLVKDFKEIFKFSNLGLMLYFMLGFIVMAFYLLNSDKKRKKIYEEKITNEEANKKIREEIGNIDIKQSVIKRLALEEDNIKL